MAELSAVEAWKEVQQLGTRVLDVRTAAERKRHGSPPGSAPVSLIRHSITPDPSAIYLCQHGVRSKVAAQRGAREIAGGFVAWRRAGLPREP
jgi:rhodanese-related sulfurtransferase